MPHQRTTRILFLALFFLSGVSGLIYQIVWTRMLVLVFGNTLLANSTVLSAFMAGLAAGSFALGEFIDRRPRRLLRLYALLEAGIGGFGLAFPVMLAWAAPFYSTLYQSLDENLLLLDLFRFSLCFLLILVPTFLMGGTLPVLVKYFVGSLDRIGNQVGFLYGLNTAGAVAGCVAAGYWLLGSLGMERTIWVAVAINLAVAAAAWVLARSEETAPRRVVGVPETSAASGTERYGGGVVAAVLVGIGLSGFCALAYEVLWVRMLNLFLNNNVYSFTATIATFLAGIALGSLLYSQLLARIEAKLALFACVEIAIGLLAYVTPFLFNLFQGALFSKQAESLTMLKTAVIMLPPTVLMGVAVPLAVQICQWGPGREGRSVGAVYAFNTVGSILGAFIAGFVLIPAIGLHSGLIAVASLNLAAGVLVLASRATRARRLVWIGAGVLLVLLLVWLAPSSLFRNLYRSANPGSEILHYKEGKVVNVVVYDFYRAGYKDLHLNGIEEASSRLWHVQLFKLLGILPPLLHEDPNEVLMIAFGAGMSAGAGIDLVDSLACVDLNPDIEGPAEIFRAENRGVIDNPKLTRIVNDGRNELLLSPKRYSVIISDATNPKMFDSWTLYTREFYELTRSRLKPGGIFAQWLVVPLPGDSVKVILNTFRSVYPHMSLWCIYGSSQCLMLGTPERLSIDYEALSRGLGPMLDPWDLREYGVDSVAKFLSFLFLGEDELNRLLAGYSKISTDDLPHPQFQLQSGPAGTRTMLELLRHQARVSDYLVEPDELPGNAVEHLDALRSIARRLHLGFLLANNHEYLKAREVSRRRNLAPDANVASALRYDSKRQEHFEKRLAQNPDDANAYNNLGYIHWMRRELEESIRHFERVLELRPDFANALTNLAQVYIEADKLEPAEAALLRLREINPTATILSLVPNRLELVRLSRKLQYHPDTPELHLALSDYHLRNSNLVQAATAMEAAVALRPQDLASRLRLAALYERLELVPETLQAYREAAALAPADPRILEKVALFQRLVIDNAALQSWLNSHEITLATSESDSDHPESCSLARKEWNDHDFQGTISEADLLRAAALFEEAVRSAPQDLHAYRDAAAIYEALGEYRRAAALLAEAASVTPRDQLFRQEARRLELLADLESRRLEPGRRRAASLELARLYWLKGEPELAVAAVTETIPEEQIDAGALAVVIRALIDAGKYEEAIKTLERALALEADEAARKRLQRQLDELAVALTPGPTVDAPTDSSPSDTSASG